MARTGIRSSAAAAPLLLLLAMALVALLAHPASAWWAPLHMTTAEIARRHLTPKARKWVTRILENDDVDGLRFKPPAHDMLGASHWPDDIKLDGFRAFDAWHYTDLPIVRDRDRMPPDWPGPNPIHDQNIVWALKEARRTLTDDKASTWSRSLMLRLLIHYAGDLHMPMHAAAFYSPDFPRGDTGGNDFPVTDPTNPEIRNLHAFWDWGAGVFPAEFSLPAAVAHRNAPDSAWLQYRELLEELGGGGNGDGPRAQGFEIPPHRLVRQIADAITAELPWDTAFPPEVRDALDTQVWLQESFTIADTHVYTPDLRPGQAITEAYREEAQVWVKQRVALGGYRLAAVLNHIFNADRKDGPETPKESYNLRTHEIILYAGFAVSFLANLWLGWACLKRRERRPSRGLHSQEWD